MEKDAEKDRIQAELLSCGHHWMIDNIAEALAKARSEGYEDGQRGRYWEGSQVGYKQGWNEAIAEAVKEYDEVLQAIDGLAKDACLAQVDGNESWNKALQQMAFKCEALVRRFKGAEKLSALVKK